MNVPLFLEIRNEYCEHLTETLIPYIYEGLNSIYIDAEKIAKEANCEAKTLLIFQKLLQSIGDWNQTKIINETDRIKQDSKTADYFDDLVKAVVKSSIILLTYSNTVSNIIGQTFYNSLSIPSFIHYCYIECGKEAHNNPYLFFKQVDPLDYKRNQIIINQKIQSGIVRAIRKFLPISLILKEYLANSVKIIRENSEINVNLLKNDKKSENSKNSTAKKINDIIISDRNQSDKKRMQTIMKLDEIISAGIADPVSIGSLHSDNPKISINNIPKTNSISKLNNHSLHVKSNNNDISNNNYVLLSHFGHQDTDYCQNSNMDTIDNKIINIKPNDTKSTNKNYTDENISMTTINSNDLPHHSKLFTHNYGPETSEKIDPYNIKLIENYGSTKKKKY